MHSHGSSPTANAAAAEDAGGSANGANHAGKWGRIHHGDALEVLRGYPDDSFDALVTDPPAGIAFMASEFDSDRGGRERWIRWLASILAECRRVLKPGGHALVWSLPRTAHWTATAVEDAGFAIRDRMSHLRPTSEAMAVFLESLSVEQRGMLASALPTEEALLNVFGNGYAKSHSVEKAIDAAAGVSAERPRAPGYRPPSGKRWNLAQADPERCLHDESAPGSFTASGVRTFARTGPASEQARRVAGYGTALKPAVEFWVMAQKPPEAVTDAQLREATGWSHYCSERMVDASSAQAAEHLRRIRASGGTAPAPFPADYRPGHGLHYLLLRRSALHEGAESELALAGLAADSEDSCSCRSEPRAEARIESAPYRPFSTDSLAANALVHGTGGLDVEAARVGEAPHVEHTCLADGEPDDAPQERKREQRRGRWPSHLLLSHAAGCGRNGQQDSQAGCAPGCPVAALDASSGRLKGGGQPARRLSDKHRNAYGAFAGGEAESGVGPSEGGASRFFATFGAGDGHPDWHSVTGNPPFSEQLPELPGGSLESPAAYFGKAQAKDRNSGLEGYAPDDGAEGINPHPTAKSLALMKYLVNLVTPPDGTVLDPFMGSGTTLCAAVATGYRAVGVEEDGRYYETARRRVAHHACEPPADPDSTADGSAPKDASPKDGQSRLF